MAPERPISSPVAIGGSPEFSRPEWLPEGWSMKVNVRKSGKVDKYYTSLSSGFTCRSKADVMHYIDIEQNAGPIALTTSCKGGDNQQMVKTPNRQATTMPAHVQYSMMKVRSNGKQRRKNPRTPVGNSPEWLPCGWKMELKTLQSGVHAGRQYKCYIDPLTRSKFYSKKAVFRYLESREFPTRSRSQKRSMETSSSLDCTSSNLRESNNKKLKSNALAQNASGDISHDWLKEITVRKANTDRGVRKNQLSIAAGQKILPGTAVRRCLFSGLVPHLNAMMVIKLDEPSKKPVLPLRSCFPAQGIQGVDLSCLAQNTERFGVGIKKMDVIPQHSVTGGLPEIRSLHQFARKELIMVNKKLLKMEELENRKLLQSENEELPAAGNIQSEERNLELMNVKLLQPAPSKSRRGHKKRRGRKKRGVAEVDNSQKQETRVLLRPRKAKAFKAITLPVRSSRRLAGLEAGPGISNLPPRSMVKRSEQCPASSIDGTHQSGVTGVTYLTNGSFDEKKATCAAELEFSKMLKCKEPTVEQAPQAEQDLEGNPNPGSPLVLPFGDSWPDPCLEFAFKTLTGDIPTVEDTAGIEEYFQQLLTSVKSPSQSSSAPSALLPSPVDFSQPECHVQHPVHDRRQYSMENGLQGGRNVNNSSR